MAKVLKTKKKFTNFVEKFWDKWSKPYAFGIGQPFRDSEGNLIAVKWLTINVGDNHGSAAVLMDHFNFFKNGVIEHEISSEEAQEIVQTSFPWCRTDGKVHRNLSALEFPDTDSLIIRFYMVEDELDDDPDGIADIHFRLALMSRQHKLPNSMNLTGTKESGKLDSMWKLPNLIWTNKGVHTIEDWNNYWFENQANGEHPLGQDKMPPMYWANPAPTGVRVANTNMIRNGAHLADGTTVMHYGFVNVNAGTLGKAMVEGRISAGTTIGDGSDIGAGSGFLGTLSGGNSTRLSMGENSLLGAMAECGIIVGNNVLIKEGVVFSAGTLVKVIKWETNADGKFITDENGKPKVRSEHVLKAGRIAGINNVTFRQHSQTGAIEVIPVPNKVQLNDMLHKND